METILGWHWTGDALRDGRPLPAVGEWLEHEGPVVICESGLHGSRAIFDALRYAPGHMLHRVEFADVVAEHSDKLVARRRRIVWSLNAEDVLRAFARRVALDVAHQWDMPDVVREYLETGREELRSAARSAAESAARSAAESAARSAAWSAAWSAAESAARSAARSTAWFAAESAAWSAARSAAWSAAESAAWSAARDKYSEWLEQMVEEARR